MKLTTHLLQVLNAEIKFFRQNKAKMSINGFLNTTWLNAFNHREMQSSYLQLRYQVTTGKEFGRKRKEALD